MTLEDYRKDFESASKRSISMPTAGAIIWLLVAAVSTQLSERAALLTLLFATGAIFPVALLIAKVRGENLVSSPNPLAKLMGYCTLMVNLLWAVHIPLFLHAPEYVPLSLGIGLGLHWVVYSWIIRHPLGIIHSVLRAVLVLAVWYSFPDARILAVGIAIVVVYGLSIYQMSTRDIDIA